MIDRRWLLGLLGSLPFVKGALAKAEVELNPESIETVEIELPVYAREGEVCTCENGHPVFTFSETVHVGQMQAPQQFKDWQQPHPRWGAYPIPGCVVCGAKWTTGMNYHFADGWRYSGQEKGLRINEKTPRT